MGTTDGNEIVCGLPGEVLWKNRSFPIFLSVIFLSSCFVDGLQVDMTVVTEGAYGLPRETKEDKH